MALHHAANKEQDAESSLQAYGLKVIEQDRKLRLLINEKATEFRRLFRDTKWASTDLSTVLKRIPGASQKRHGAIYIGGKTVRPLSLPLYLQSYIE